MAQEPKDRQKSVRIRTLGRFEVEVDGVPLRVSARGHSKPLELLKLLVALGGEGVPIERLTDAIWSDIDGDLARRALNTTLYRLRKQIGVDSLRLADARLSLDFDRCWVDAWTCADALEGAARACGGGDVERAWALAQDALALYRGPFLDGEFDLPDVLTAREKMHGLFLRHVESLGAYFRDRGDTERAIALYRQGLECDELAEGFYQALMLCYRDAGRQGEAVSLYRRCRGVLRAGGGIEPAPETTALYESIVASTRSRLPAAPASKEPTVAETTTAGAIGGAHEDRLSLAVRPLVNLSNDPQQDYFARGFAEDLIIELSQLPRLFVIAHHSSFTAQGQGLDARQVGAELGVRYVLEGSVYKAGSRVRVSVQLVDAASGERTWGRKYDRQFRDVFALQDEITRDIAAELEIKLVEGEQARVWRRTTNNPESYDLTLRGRYFAIRNNRVDNLRGRGFMERALELDPENAYAMVQLGWTYVVEGNYGGIKDWEAGFDRAIELGKRATAIHDSLGEGYSMLSMAYMTIGKHDLGLEYAERAVTVNPESADANAFLCSAFVRVGRGAEALDPIQTAMRLNPFPPAMYCRVLGGAYQSVRQYDKAIAAYRECLEQLPDYMRVHILLTLTYMEAEREEEARAQARHVLRIDPGFSSASNTTVISYQARATRERYISLLRKAGLPG